MSVSCLCITYLRSNILEEAIECFLRQTYKGKKELIIINDAEEQILEFDHPEVLIINSPRRFKTIGEKRNASIALSKYDYLAPWDDDDIFLPNKLEYSLGKVHANNLEYYKMSEAFFCLDGEIKGTMLSLFHSSCIFSRKLYTESNGYGFVNSGQDLYLESQLWNICKKKKYKWLIENTRSRSPWNRNKLAKQEDLYYIYRWGGVSYHLSSTRAEENQLEIIANERKKIEKRTGKITLNPHWKKDYNKMCQEFIKYSSLKST